MATAEALLTAEEYRLLPDNGQPTELVRGRVVTLNIPAPRHGQICVTIGYLLRRHFETSDLGHVVSNDSAVITEHGPDTVRGPDVAFYSYQRVPKGPLPRGYLQAAPELVFEVRSPGDRWSKILAKVAEFLEAGVKVACVLDDQTQTLTVYREDQSPVELAADDEFTLPEILGDFRVKVQRFFG
jgi:Uma2 family endonuclease